MAHVFHYVCLWFLQTPAHKAYLHKAIRLTFTPKVYIKQSIPGVSLVHSTVLLALLGLNIQFVSNFKVASKAQNLKLACKAPIYKLAPQGSKSQISLQGSNTTYMSRTKDTCMPLFACKPFLSRLPNLAPHEKACRSPVVLPGKIFQRLEGW